MVETLRAAAPWQRLRGGGGGERVQVRRDDFRIRRFAENRETTTIFAVDASAPPPCTAWAEAKGAVETAAGRLLRAARQRGAGGLPRQRGGIAAASDPVARARQAQPRGIAGRRGDPLAAGLDAALAVAEAVRQRGQTPVIVVLTDGRANIGRDGRQGRGPGAEDALAAAGRIRVSGVASLLIDTSPRPAPQGADVAAAMGARYLPLPQADAAGVSAAVKAIAAA